MYLTQDILEASVNMSIMANGENSRMMHSARTCTTMKMKKTTENHTTTILTILWYCNVLIFCFILFYKNILTYLTCYRPKHHQRALRNILMTWWACWKQGKQCHRPTVASQLESTMWKWDWVAAMKNHFSKT